MHRTHVITLLGLLIASCGRVDYEPRECPQGTVPVDGDAGPAFCVEVDQSAPLRWNDAQHVCESRGLALCTDEEWTRACLEVGPLLADMVDDWEWTSLIVEEGVAGKRGAGSCEATSSHGFGDPYPYRCCGPR